MEWDESWLLLPELARLQQCRLVGTIEGVPEALSRGSSASTDHANEVLRGVAASQGR